MTDLEKTKKDLENFLKEHPELQDFQNKIEEALNSVPDEQRLGVISTMLASSAINLNKAMAIGLQNVINENIQLKQNKKLDKNINDVFDKL